MLAKKISYQTDDGEVFRNKIDALKHQLDDVLREHVCADTAKAVSALILNPLVRVKVLEIIREAG